MTQHWLQRTLSLTSKTRGFHLITDEILEQVPEIKSYTIGIAHLHLLHTSASLCLNENWDPTVQADLEMFMNKLVPENLPYKHSYEGPDDMPAHIKNCLIGANISIPLTNGRFRLGQWQGIYLVEHRDKMPQRSVVVTLNGLRK